MLQTRLNYQICPLHDEPLNYLCLHAKCHIDRIICAICKEERHSASHTTTPLKIYLSHKAEQLKCLTNTKLNLITHSLQELKDTINMSLANLKSQIDLELERLAQQCQSFFDQKLDTLSQYQNIIANQELQVKNLQKVEKILKIVIQHEQYGQQFSKKLESVQQLFKKELQTIKLNGTNTKQQWIAHSKIQIIQNVIKSNENGYKIAHLSKLITKNQPKIILRIVNSVRNWIGVGVCFENIVRQRNYLFRYHTIGHGLYMIASNGGIWSHHKSQFNNKLGGITFSDKQTIKIYFDWKDHKVIFENQVGQKFSLQVDQTQMSNLHFCTVLYYQQDEVEVVSDLIAVL